MSGILQVRVCVGGAPGDRCFYPEERRQKAAAPYAGRCAIETSQNAIQGKNKKDSR
jgi:hypothetical protein